MGFVYAAGDWEADILRQVFGPEVREVTFWDAEDRADGFVFATAEDRHGEQIGSVSNEDPEWYADHDGMCLGDIPSERGKTVKFHLALTAPEDS